jgi:ribonuclease R
VHEGPTEEKLENLRSFLGELGLDLSGGIKPTPLDYQQLLQQVAERDDAHVIQVMLLRSLRQAVYQPENNGHFGLHYPAYAHFTSPIRRYPDLLVHRGIRHLVRSTGSAEAVLRVAGAEPMTERRADDATREVDSWLKCEYLQEHVGDEFDGVIAAVTGFGLFVELVDLYIEGLVHVTALPGDYYSFDAAHQRLTGERSGRSFQLGGKVRVQVARVDLDDRKIDLELIDSAPPRKSKRKKTGAKPGGSGGNKGGRGGKGGAAAPKAKAKRKTGQRRRR